MFALILAWAPAVENRPPPAPDAVGPLMAGLAIAIIVVSLVWFGIRRMQGRGTEAARRSTGGAAVGNALFELGSILQPDRPNVETIVRLEEEAVEDDVGDGRDPARPRASPRPAAERRPAPRIESGPERAATFKAEVHPVDAAEQRGHDQRAADRSPDALPPSVPRE